MPARLRPPSPLHFDGPIVAGGGVYEPAEILAQVDSQRLPTGIEPLDDAVGGIAPGEVWTICGPAGIGVSSLVERCAAAAAQVGTVLLANGHLGSRALAEHVIRGPLQARPGSLRIASWLPLPWLGDERWDGACEKADLVILDTWDEMWRPPHWGRSVEERIADARWLRELARRSGTALLLTARLALQDAVTDGARTGGDPRGRYTEVFDDIADVAVELAAGDTRRSVTVRARRRGGAAWSGPVALGR